MMIVVTMMTISARLGVHPHLGESIDKRSVLYGVLSAKDYR